MPGSLLSRYSPVPGASVSFCCVTRYCSGESLETASGSLLNFLICFSSYRTSMEGTSVTRSISEQVGPRTSRSAGLSRRYKSTASARFPGRGRARYEECAEGSGTHPRGSVPRWHLPVPSSRPGLQRCSRPLLLDECAIRTRLRPESKSPPAPSRDLEPITSSVGPRAVQACPPSRPLSAYRPVRIRGLCRRPHRPTRSLQPAQKESVSYGVSFKYAQLNPCIIRQLWISRM